MYCTFSNKTLNECSLTCCVLCLKTPVSGFTIAIALCLNHPVCSVGWCLLSVVEIAHRSLQEWFRHAQNRNSKFRLQEDCFYVLVTQHER